MWSDDVCFLRYGARQTDEWTDRWTDGKKWHIEVGALPKNDMMNLVNFNASSGKSENLHFDALLLSIAYKYSAKKCRRVISDDTEK